MTEYWSSKISRILDDLRSASGKHTGSLKVSVDETEGYSRDWKVCLVLFIVTVFCYLLDLKGIG
jgi:hypothetical protein